MDAEHASCLCIIWPSAGRASIDRSSPACAKSCAPLIDWILDTIRPHMHAVPLNALPCNIATIDRII